MICQRSRRHLG